MQEALSVEVAGCKNIFFWQGVGVQEAFSAEVAGSNFFLPGDRCARALSGEVAGCKKIFLPGGRGAGGIIS